MENISNKSTITITTFSSPKEEAINKIDTSFKQSVPCPPSRPPPPIIGLLGNSLDSCSSVSPASSSDQNNSSSSSDEDVHNVNQQQQRRPQQQQQQTPPPPPPLPRRPPPVIPWSSSESDADDTSDKSSNDTIRRRSSLTPQESSTTSSEVTIKTRHELTSSKDHNNVSIINVIDGSCHLDSVDSGVSVAGSDTENNHHNVSVITTTCLNQGDEVIKIKSESSSKLSLNDQKDADGDEHDISVTGVVDISSLSPIKLSNDTIWNDKSSSDSSSSSSEEEASSCKLIRPTKDVVKEGRSPIPDFKQHEPLRVVINNDNTNNLVNGSPSPSSSKRTGKNGGRFSISPVTSASPDFALFEPECGSIYVFGASSKLSQQRQQKMRSHSSSSFATSTDHCDKSSPQRLRHHSDGQVTSGGKKCGNRFTVSPSFGDRSKRRIDEKEGMIFSEDEEEEASAAKDEEVTETDDVGSEEECARSKERGREEADEEEEERRSKQEQQKFMSSKRTCTSSSSSQKEGDEVEEEKEQKRSEVNSIREEEEQGSKDSNTHQKNNSSSSSSFSSSKRRFLFDGETDDTLLTKQENVSSKQEECIKSGNQNKAEVTTKITTKISSSSHLPPPPLPPSSLPISTTSSSSTRLNQSKYTTQPESPKTPPSPLIPNRISCSNSPPKLVSVKILSPSKVVLTSPLDGNKVSNIPRAIQSKTGGGGSKVVPSSSSSPTFKSVGWIDSDGEEEDAVVDTLSTSRRGIMTVISNPSTSTSSTSLETSNHHQQEGNNSGSNVSQVTSGQQSSAEEEKQGQTLPTLDHSCSIDTDSNGSVIVVTSEKDGPKKLKGLLKKSLSDTTSSLLLKDGGDSKKKDDDGKEDGSNKDVHEPEEGRSRQRKKSVTFSETMMVFCDDWPMEMMPQIMALKSPSADSFNLIEIASSGYMFEPPIEYQDMLPFDPPPDYRDIINQAVHFAGQQHEGYNYNDDDEGSSTAEAAAAANYWGSILNNDKDDCCEDDIIGLLKQDSILQAIGSMSSNSNNSNNSNGTVTTSNEGPSSSSQFTPPMNEVNLGQDDFPVHYFKLPQPEQQPSPCIASKNSSSSDCIKSGTSSCMMIKSSNVCMDQEKEEEQSNDVKNNIRTSSLSPTMSLDSLNSGCSSLTTSSSCDDYNVQSSDNDADEYTKSSCNSSNLTESILTFNNNNNNSQTGRVPLSSLQASTINYHLHNLHLQAAAAAASSSEMSPSGTNTSAGTSTTATTTSSDEMLNCGSIMSTISSPGSGSLQDLASDSSFTSQDTIIMMTNALINASGTASGSNSHFNSDDGKESTNLDDVDLIFDTNDADLNSLMSSDHDHDEVTNHGKGSISGSNDDSTGSINKAKEEEKEEGMRNDSSSSVNVSKEEVQAKEEKGRMIDESNDFMNQKKVSSSAISGNDSKGNTSSVQDVVPDVVPPLVPLRKPQNIQSINVSKENVVLSKRLPDISTGSGNSNDQKMSMVRRSSNDSNATDTSDGNISSDTTSGNMSDVSSNCSIEPTKVTQKITRRPPPDVPPKIPPLPVRKNSTTSVQEIRKAFESKTSSASSSFDSQTKDDFSPTKDAAKDTMPKDTLPPTAKDVSKRPKSFPSSSGQEVMFNLISSATSSGQQQQQTRQHHQSSFDISPTTAVASKDVQKNVQSGPTINPCRLRFHSGPPTSSKPQLTAIVPPPVSPTQHMSTSGHQQQQEQNKWTKEDMLIEYTSEPRTLSSSKRANSCSNFHANTLPMSLPAGQQQGVPNVVPKQAVNANVVHNQQQQQQMLFLQNQRAVQEHIYQSLNRRDPHNHLLTIYHPQQQQQQQLQGQPQQQPQQRVMVGNNGNQTLPHNLRLPPRSASVMGTQQPQQQLVPGQQQPFNQQQLIPGQQQQQQLLLRTVPMGDQINVIHGQQQQQLAPCCQQHVNVQHQLAVRNQMIWQQQLHQHLLRQQQQQGSSQGTVSSSSTSLSAASTASSSGGQQQAVNKVGVPDIISNTINVVNNEQQKLVLSGQQQQVVMSSPRIAHVRPAIHMVHHITGGHGPLPPIPGTNQQQPINQQAMNQLIVNQSQQQQQQLVNQQQQLMIAGEPMYQTLQPTCSCCPRNPHAFPGQGKLVHRIAQLLPSNVTSGSSSTSGGGRFPNASEIRRRDGLNAYPQIVRPNSMIVTGSANGGHPLDGQQQQFGDGPLSVGVAEDADLAQFVEREKERTERIRQRYAEPEMVNDEDPSFGFSKRPAVRGIKS